MTVWLELTEVVELVVPQFEVDLETLSELVGEFVEVLDTDTVDVAETHVDVDTVSEAVAVLIAVNV